MGIDRSSSPGHPPHDVEAWCRDFQDGCRQRGIRVTPQRLAVYRALAGDTGHPTADHLFARIRPQLPSVSLATVYRILESFEKEGLIRRVSTTNGVGRFDANLTPHQHLVCRVCGDMVDYSAPALSRLPLPKPARSGFVAEMLDIRILGVCESCRTSAPPETPRSQQRGSGSSRH